MIFIQYLFPFVLFIVKFIRFISKKKERLIKRESHIGDMRVKTSLTGKGSIPFNYNMALAGAVYGAVKRANTELASQIHSSTKYKYFTFSLLQIPERRVSPKGIYVEGGCFFLVFSPTREVISSFVEGILERHEVRIGGVQFEVEGVELMRSPEFVGEKDSIGFGMVKVMRDGV